MTIVSDIPALTASDLAVRAREAAQNEQQQRQREKERAEQVAEAQRQEALDAEKFKFLRTLRDLWGDLAGMPLDLAIDDDDLVHDGKHWRWQFQPGLKIGFDYNAARHPSVAQPFLMAFTAYNRSSYRVESLAALGHILEQVRSAQEAEDQRNALKQQREQEAEEKAAEEHRRQQELESKIAEIEDREPALPDFPVCSFEDGAAGIQTAIRHHRLILRPFRLNGDSGPMWEFEIGKYQVEGLLNALESRAVIRLDAGNDRLIVTRPVHKGEGHPDEVLWMCLPSFEERDYTTHETPGQVMVQRGVDTVAFKDALRDWLAYVAQRDAWEAERRAALDAHETEF